MSVCADPVSVSSSCLILPFTFPSLARVCLFNMYHLCSGLWAPSTEDERETKSGHCFSGIFKVWMVGSATGTDGNKADSVGTVDGVPWERVFVRVTWVEEEFEKLRIQQARKQESYCRVTQMKKWKYVGFAELRTRRTELGLEVQGAGTRSLGV